MKIKRYLGTDMRDALRQIRQELGADAVILSTSRSGRGVEVTAAVDAQVLQGRGSAAVAEAVAAAPYSASAPLAPSAVAPAAVAAAAAPAVAAATRGEAPPADAPTADAPTAAGAQLAMSEELRTLRQLLERQLAALAWNDYTRREPLRAQALAELTELGLARDIALRILEELPEPLSAEQAQRMHLGLLARRLAVCESPTANPGAVALIGAAGSGKTTMLAKLALRWLLEHGSAGLALVTIDDEHIGAADQARTLGRLLGVPSFRVASGEEFVAERGRFAGHELLLVDTPALVADPEQCAALAAALNGVDLDVQSMLLLPASAQGGVLDEMVRRAEPLGPVCCAVTRCDEAVSLGGVLSTLVRSGLPVAYVSDGPRIPDDLRPARAHQLVARAAELARLSGTRFDSELLAQRYGGKINAAA